MGYYYVIMCQLKWLSTTRSFRKKHKIKRLSKGYPRVAKEYEYGDDGLYMGRLKTRVGQTKRFE